MCTNSQIAECFTKIWVVPPEVEICTSMDSCEWERSPWGECSTDCGYGQRQRNVTCIEGELGFCEEEGPGHHVEAETCHGYNGCHWIAADWSDCSETCGQGVHTRSIECPGGNTSRCLQEDGDAPVEQEGCHDISGCNSSHFEFSSDWSLCSESCGAGIRTRNATCSPKGGSLSPIGCQQPGGGVFDAPYSEACVNRSGCKWLVSSWGPCSSACGKGQQHRSVVCSSGRAEDCRNAGTAPRRMQACSRSSGCVTLRQPDDTGLQLHAASGCSCDVGDPLVVISGVLNAFVGWIIGCAGLASICRGSASLLSPHSIFLINLCALVGGLCLDQSLIAAIGGAGGAVHKVSVAEVEEVRCRLFASSQFAVGLLGLGCFGGSLCGLGAPVGLGFLPRSRWQALWPFSCLALTCACCLLLLMPLRYIFRGGDGHTL